MLNNHQATSIAELFYLLDTNVRIDLHKGQIADERDYVSRLVTHFNYPFGIFNKFFFGQLKFQSKWFSRVNSGHYERKFGCDSMIVFQVGNRYKVGLFEAKWARVISDPTYQWDYAQKSTKSSHFTSQIERQALWTKDAVIWEMFFYEQQVNKLDNPFDKNASTCILHKYAKQLVDSTPSLQTVWSNSDLKDLIISAQTKKFDGENETNIKDIIFNILVCKYGTPIICDPTDKSFYLNSNDNDDRARIPISSFGTDNQDDQIIEGFMAETGLSFFQHLKIETPNEDDKSSR